jgi:hypothetical protein
MKPKCDDEQRHISVETTRERDFYVGSGSWENEKYQERRRKKEDAPCATDKRRYTYC